MTWQKKARVGVAIFGLGAALVVYRETGQRAAQIQTDPPERLDPKAIIESSGARLQQDRGTERDFDVTSERQLYYEDGSSKLVGVRIVVRGRAGRDFVVAGREARATGNEQDLQLSGDVTLTASDGFVLHAGEATFNRKDALMTAPGPITFAKGRMTGSGTGMSYDEANDILSIAEHARIAVAGDDGTTPIDLSANTATLKRAEHLLELDGTVHVLRGEQVIDGDRALARLSEGDDAVTFLELRGNARVAGGSGALDSMTARDIDLDYTDDGQLLERVALTENASIVMTGSAGSTGRQLSAATLDLTLAPDGAVTHAAGREQVRFVLPAGNAAPARVVTSRVLDAVGEPGRGLTSATFTDDVVYRETEQRDAVSRNARSRALVITFASEAVTEAVFTGNATFQEEGLAASGAEARYRPGAGTLRLTGTDAGGPPHVADERIDVIADAIDLTLEGRNLAAARNVKTTLRPGAARGQGSGTGRTGSTIPGLLKGNQPAFVNAGALQYQGDSGTATYTGSAALWQAETAIRADRITIDQGNGNLVAVGNARSSLALDNGTSAGRAAEIRYDDAARTMTYVGATAPPPGPLAQRPSAPGATRPGQPAQRPTAPPEPRAQAQLSGPQGDVQADRVEVLLATGGGRAERLEGYGAVTARVDARVATGSRLTYIAADDRYLMAGDTGVPVTVVDTCRTTTGKSLIFFKSTDRIIVDGNEQVRTQTTSSGACPDPAATR